jgi:WD40 repeat protein
MPEPASAAQPYIGLLSFGYEDCDFFFGRKQQIDRLEPLVLNRRFVAIVGSSGSGKSSLVRAGLLPRFEARPESWGWVEMRPGSAPIRALAESLGKAQHGVLDDLAAARTDRIELVLRRSSFGLIEAYGLLPKPRPERLLIVVDQFEELFRFSDLDEYSTRNSKAAARRRDEATAFVQLLLAVNSPSFTLPIHVVITMRSDFIGECARFHNLPESVSAHQFLVPGLTRDQRSEAIRGPAQKANGAIDMELVQRALNDTTEELDQLPILQHVMMRCWQKAAAECCGPPECSPKLTAKHYRAVGEAANALSVHANEMLDRLRNLDHLPDLGIPRPLIAKRLFQSLTDVDKSGRVVRRPQKFTDLLHCATGNRASYDDLSHPNARRVLAAVIYHFAGPSCNFLAAPPESNLEDNSIIDIGHEALIRNWDKLKGGGDTDWIREEQEDGEQYRGLLRIARANVTIPPEELATVERWWRRCKPNRYWAARYGTTARESDEGGFDDVIRLLGRSRAHATQLEEQRRQTEQAERQALQAKAEAAEAEAQRQAEEAATKRQALEAKAEAAAAEARRQAVEAAANIRRQRSNFAIAAIVLITFMLGALLWQENQKHNAIVSKAQAEIAARNALLDKLGAEVKANEAGERELAYASKVLSFAAERVSRPSGVVGPAEATALLLAKPDRLPSTSDYERSLFLAVGDLREFRRLDHLETPVSGLAVSPHGDVLAGVSAGQGHMLVRFWEAATGSLIDAIELAASGFGNVRWSPDGERVFVGTSPVGFVLTPCSREALRRFFRSCANQVADLRLGSADNPAAQGAWSSDGRLVMTGGFQREAKLWDASTGKLIGMWDPLEGQFVPGESATQPAAGIAFSRDGSRLAIGSPAGEIHIIKANSLTLETRLIPKASERGGQIFSLAFDPTNSNRLLVTSQLAVHLWDIAAHAAKQLHHDGAAVVFQGVFEPGGKFLATSSDDGSIRLFPREGDNFALHGIVLRGHRGPSFALDVTRDGVIISGSNDRTVRFWKRYSPFSPKPTEFANARRGATVQTEARSARIEYDGKIMSFELPRDFGEVAAADVSPNGRYVVLAPRHGVPAVFLKDVGSTPLGQLRGPQLKWDRISFDGSGTTIVGATSTGLAYAWPFFTSSDELKSIAKQNLPLRQSARASGGVGVPISAQSEILCVLFGSEDDCRAAPGLERN